MVLFYNPMLIILFNESDNQYYPAIASETQASKTIKTEAFNHLFNGVVRTYLKKGFDTLDEAKKEIVDVLADEIEVEGRYCLNSYIKWSGIGQPSMAIHAEFKDGEHHLVV